MSLKIVGVSGSLARLSHTTALVGEILDSIAERSDYQIRLIELVDEAPHIFSALTRCQLGGRGAEIVGTVEQADLLIVGTPVCCASYTGALKHLFELVDPAAFNGKPVIMAATGNTPQYRLIIEHQLRPLFSFLNALILPTAIYTTEQDFLDYSIVGTEVQARIERAGTEGLEQLGRYSFQPRKFADSDPSLLLTVGG